MTRTHVAAAWDGPVKLSVHEPLTTRGKAPRTQVFVRTADEVTL
jgi:hypothetical protein